MASAGALLAQLRGLAERMKRLGDDTDGPMSPSATGAISDCSRKSRADPGTPDRLMAASLSEGSALQEHFINRVNDAVVAKRAGHQAEPGGARSKVMALDARAATSAASPPAAAAADAANPGLAAGPSPASPFSPGVHNEDWRRARQGAVGGTPPRQGLESDAAVGRRTGAATTTTASLGSTRNGQESRVDAALDASTSSGRRLRCHRVDEHPGGRRSALSSPNASDSRTLQTTISAVPSHSSSSSSPCVGDDDEGEDDEAECRRSRRARAADAEGAKESSIADGVRTTVLWNSTDPLLYCDCLDAIWQPEEVEVCVAGPHHCNDHGEMKEDADSDGSEGAAAAVVVGTPPDTQEAVVVPSLPLGGGITLGQLRMLVARSRRSRPANAAPARKPLTAAEILELSDATLLADGQDFIEVDAAVRFNREQVSQLRRAQVRERYARRHATAAPRDPVADGGCGPGELRRLQLSVLYEPLRTGFEETKEYPLVPGSVVAGRYEIVDILGQGTFCRVVRCFDLHQPLEVEGDEAEHEDGSSVVYQEVCLKFVQNSKDFFDQSLDEVKLLSLLAQYADPEDVHVVGLIDFFYWREHMVLVTELLSDNLYEYQRFDRESEGGQYFTLPRLQKIARQITEALAYVHSLDLIHCDLKPENVLFRSHRRCEVKVIDFGSSCFISDPLSTYIQSRSYRAPEVILGCEYDGRIDVWSLGAIMVELVTAEVLFSSETVAEMLARIVAMTGTPFSRRMLFEGANTHHFVNRFGAIFEKGIPQEEGAEECLYIYTPATSAAGSGADDGESRAELLVRNVNVSTHQPIIEKLVAAGVVDDDFFDFVRQCLTVDAHARPTSAALLAHPFLSADLAAN